MTELLTLAGCTPEPLMSYLKALGVFRLVAEQADSVARGMWKGDRFVLESSRQAADLLPRRVPTDTDRRPVGSALRVLPRILGVLCSTGAQCNP
jgi:hypothetical protein